VFKDLDFVPDPMPGPEGVFLPFEEVYNVMETNDLGRPSLSMKAPTSEIDKNNSALLKGTRVRDVIKCSECARPRCIFAATRLTNEEILAVKAVKDEDNYICGDVLFQEDSIYYDKIVVRNLLSCAKIMETTYYAKKISSAHFPSVCFHCGSGNTIIDEGIQNLKRKFKVVRPICGECKQAGKEPVVKCQVNVAKKPRL
jgi:hypothetical protein